MPRLRNEHYSEQVEVLTELLRQKDIEIQALRDELKKYTTGAKVIRRMNHYEAHKPKSQNSDSESFIMGVVTGSLIGGMSND